MNPSPTDVSTLFERLRRVVSRRNLVIEEFGTVGGHPLWFLHPITLKSGPTLLVAAGFHGEEPAGCWGVLRHLESSGRLDELANVSYLPLVNPTGIRLGRRENDWGENPNRGFCHGPTAIPNPSVEGRILLDSLERIRPWAKDGFITLHEDIGQDRFYLYTFENEPAPGPFSKALVEVESRFFAPVPDGPLYGEIVRGGVVFNQCDGSFEDFMFHDGVPHTACTETPGALDFNRRVEANEAIIEAFLRFHVVPK